MRCPSVAIPEVLFSVLLAWRPADQAGENVCHLCRLHSRRPRPPLSTRPRRGPARFRCARPRLSSFRKGRKTKKNQIGTGSLRSGPRPSHRTRGTSTRPAGRGRQHARAVDPADRAHHGRRRRYGRAAVRGPLDFQAEQGACACLPASSLPAPLPGRCRGCWGALPSCGCTRSVADTAA